MAWLIAFLIVLPDAVRAAPYQAYSHVETGSCTGAWGRRR